MPRVLVNDGMPALGIQMLKDHGFDVSTVKISQQDLNEKLQEYDAICVRSATKVRKELIDLCPNLKLIGRGGVGMDNIDVDYAKSKGIHVVNTPAASSRSVAELAFSHLFSIARFLYISNKTMPERGHQDFTALKKSFSKGFELEGKTIGIIGMGRIGQETTKIALGLGMNVLASDPFVESVILNCKFAGQNLNYLLKSTPLNEMLPKLDVLSLHIPFTGAPVLSSNEFAMMKDGAILINVSRGGTVDETAMLEALNSGKLGAAGVDVFENEPTPLEAILKHPRVSSTPHIGASTVEAQNKIGQELAQQIIKLIG